MNMQFGLDELLFTLNFNEPSRQSLCLHTAYTLQLLLSNYPHNCLHII